MKNHKCRFCGHTLQHSFLDLGMSPLSNAFLTRAARHKEMRYFPLHAYVCEACFLVQLEEFASPEGIFSEYAYFSSYSSSWLDHAETYQKQVTADFCLTRQSLVMEIASNDGYLLQYFKRSGIPVYGIEPAKNVAETARKKGIPTISEFFGTRLALDLVARGIKADLLIANNVLAHVPDLNDFVAGMKQVLNERGLLTVEFPHLLRLMEENQFDTIYHEHFSYFSLLTVQQVFARHGLTVFKVEQLPTHGGSLRVFVRHDADQTKPVGSSVAELLANERAAGLDRIDAYLHFKEKVEQTKRSILQFLINAKEAGKSIAGYGAPAKANTLLNYCGISTDFIDYTVDRNPYKQDLFLPGSNIPVHHPEKLQATRPDYVIILPWNLKDEIVAQLDFIKEWGGKCVVLIPCVEVL